MDEAAAPFRDFLTKHSSPHERAFFVSSAETLWPPEQAENLYAESLNSGQAEVGAAASGGRGVIRGGQLESSNVDIALEFTKLIVAQRGFSANARTITVSDEVLEELTNIIR